MKTIKNEIYLDLGIVNRLDIEMKNIGLSFNHDIYIWIQKDI
jgi:hypothetical protein